MSQDKRPTILASHRFPDAVENRLTNSFKTILPNVNTQFSQAELLQHALRADGLLVAPGAVCDANFIESLPQNIKIISTFSVGYDHIDIAAANKRGIMITNTPDVLTDATADIAMLLLLGATRRAFEAASLLASQNWAGWTPSQFLGRQITGKRLGLFGMGRIGRAFAHRARACDMEIHYHNRQRLPDALERGAIFHENLDSLLAVSDVLSLHAPSTAATRQLIDREKLDLLPDHAVVINTARGDLVVDDDVIAACKSGKLSAIGLDVFDGEPNLHPGYLTLPNAFLLPHLGSATVETRNAMGFRALNNLEAYFDGQECPDQLT